MKIKVTVIYYEVQNKKKYISELSMRWDDKFLAMYSDDKNDARQFENESEAKIKITRIVNHCNHSFKIEPLEVKVSRKNPFSQRVKAAMENDLV